MAGGSQPGPFAAAGPRLLLNTRPEADANARF